LNCLRGTCFLPVVIKGKQGPNFICQIVIKRADNSSWQGMAGETTCSLSAGTYMHIQACAAAAGAARALDAPWLTRQHAAAGPNHRENFDVRIADKNLMLSWCLAAEEMVA
jgi:hypothetical protein